GERRARAVLPHLRGRRAQSPAPRPAGLARRAARHPKAQEDLKEAGVPRTSSKWKDLQKDINRTKQLVTRRALEENTVKATRAAERIIGGGYRFLERYVSWSS
ncbi:unnamed protein product, partial [Heterosigma akashiwo]